MTYLLALVCGIVSSLPLMFPGTWFLGWFSLAPLFVIAKKGKKPYLHGLVYGYGFYLVLFYWFIKLYPMDFAGFTNAQSVALIALCWAGLASLQAAEIAFVPFVFSLLRSEKHKWLFPLSAACCYTAFEWAQTIGWTGVPWGRLAVGQTAALPAVAIASVGGSLLVGFLMVLVNGLIALALLALKEKGKDALKTKPVFLPALLALSLFCGNLLFGAIRTPLLKKDAEKAEPIQVGCIQGNIASGDKWADDSVAHSMELYLSLSEKATNEGAKIIVWPETVITVSVRTSPQRRKTLSEFASSHGVELIVGSYDTGYEGNDPDQKLYNSLVLFHADGTVGEKAYHKRHLVPFGEYLPMRPVLSLIPLLSEMNLFDSDLAAGKDSDLFDTPFGKIGALVCFDSIYDELARDAVGDGAELIVLGTNDSWYRDSAAIYQHNSHAVLRAIENGRYIARAANTGISTVITPWGEVTSLLAPLTEGYVVDEVRFQSRTTVYTVIGDLIAYLSLAGIAVIAAVRIADKKKTK